MPTVLNTKLDRHSDLVPTDRLSLTAEERQRARCPFTTLGNVEVYLQLERGLFLQQGDKLQAEDGSLVVEILAKPERVMAVTAVKSIDLLQAAYHLGNRHVPLEVTESHLYLLPDAVLQDLLQHRGLTVVELDRPFQPQAGAYDRHHH
jgi:urease accessory protein